MGKGDHKTRRGKLFIGSYGVLRPRKKNRPFSVVTTTKKTATEPDKSKAATKPKTESKPKAEPVAEEAKPLAEEAKTVVEKVEEKAEAKPAAKKTAAKKPAAKKPTAKKETSKKDPPKEEA